MVIRFIFVLFACALLLWIKNDIQTGIAMPMNRHAKEMAAWDSDPLEFLLAIALRGFMALGCIWYALFHKFGEVKNFKNERRKRRQERLNKK